MTTFHKIERPNLLVEGTITVLLKSGKHFTYEIRTVKKGDLEGKRIVSLLNGPDNQTNYKGFGFVVDNPMPGQEPIIKLWKKCRSDAFFKHMALLEGAAQEHVIEWMQEGRCMKCGRKLTTPESLRTGIGPVCGGRS